MSPVMYNEKELLSSDNETLLLIIKELDHKLRQKNLELSKTRTKLSAAKVRLVKMKDTVYFQRQRILELYNRSL